jgi:peroxiredoxin
MSSLKTTRYLALLASFLFPAVLQAGKFNKVLSIGDAAPEWKNLTGIDDKQHSLADYKQKKLVVLVFTCNHCPVAQAYQQRLIDLQKNYGPKGLQVVAISVSNLASDRLDKMKELVKEQSINFPYLHDATQKSGAAYGAAVTPHVFLLDSQRKIAYMGAFDDSLDAGDVQRHYLRDAVDALLAGKEVEVKESRPMGCSIEYDEP